MKRILFSIVCILCILPIAGCFTQGNELTPSFSKQHAIENTQFGKFFICSNWRKYIPAGFHTPGLSETDFKDIKTDFTVGIDQQIMFVYRYDADENGKTVHLIIYDPNGNRYSERKQKLFLEGPGFYYPYWKVQDIYGSGGKGRWKAEWYIDDMLAKTLTFTLIPAPAGLTKATVSDKNTQLIQAVKDGNLPAMQILLDDGANVNAKNNFGATALMVAAEEGHMGIVKLLLEKGAEINASRTTGGTATLVLAVIYGDTEVVKLLLEKGADVNAKADSGAPILWVAAANGHTEIVKLLLGKGADVNAKTNDGLTALWAAKNFSHPNIVQLLEKAGAKE